MRRGLFIPRNVGTLRRLQKSASKKHAKGLDNHRSDVAPFKILLNINPGDKKHYFVLPHAEYKNNVFFDPVHIIKKNIRNNLVYSEAFVFTGLNFQASRLQFSSEPGSVSWYDLYKIQDKDQNLNANFRKAPLYPEDRKQNVS